MSLLDNYGKKSAGLGITGLVILGSTLAMNNPDHKTAGYIISVMALVASYALIRLGGIEAPDEAFREERAHLPQPHYPSNDPD